MCDNRSRFVPRRWPHQRCVSYRQPRDPNVWLAVSIEDANILAEQKHTAATEGLYVGLKGAVNVAAARKLCGEGWIRSDEVVVALNTGSGIKYPETVAFDAPVLGWMKICPCTSHSHNYDKMILMRWICMMELRVKEVWAYGLAHVRHD